MKKLKKFVMGVINWFRVKWQNSQYKEQINKLEQKVLEQEKTIMELEDLTDKQLNVQRVKDLRNSLEHQYEIKHQLRQENKELREQIREMKSR